MSQEQRSFQVTEGQEKQRLDKWLAAELPEYSRAKIQQWIEAGHLQCVDKIEQNASRKIMLGESYQLTIPTPPPSHLEPCADIALNVVYEDEYLLVINKQAGLTVHPGAGNKDRTLVNALLAMDDSELSQTGGVERPGIVHRLDKDTSGLMIVAKQDQCHMLLSAALARREIKREYIAFTHGVLLPPLGIIRGNIARSPMKRTMMMVVKGGGKEAVTHYKTEATYGLQDFSQLRLQLETGRTHQIRVHLLHRRVPVLGDPTYKMSGKNLSSRLPLGVRETVLGFTRQALHAAKLSFTHPMTQQELQFTAPLPEDMLCLQKALEQW